MRELDFDFEGMLSVLGVAVLTGLAVLGFTAVVADHKVQSYYISNNNTTLVICVRERVNWSPDQPVFCSDDKERVLDFVTKANATLK